MSNDHNRRHPSAGRPYYEAGQPHYEAGQPHYEARQPHYEARQPHYEAGQSGGRAYPQSGQPATPGEDNLATQGRPQPGGPQPAPRKRSRWVLVFGGLFVVMILGLAGLLVFALGGAGPVMNALGIDRNTGKAADGKINKPIADGTFEFTVTAARCGLYQVGDGKAAQGQFCLIDVTVKNVGTAPVIFDDISQTAYDATGNQYSADSSADVAANKDRPAFLQRISPGATVQGRLAFDISTREKLIAIVLHESIFSDGVRIPLTT